jgi:hypothetical protein
MFESFELQFGGNIKFKDSIFLIFSVNKPFSMRAEEHEEWSIFIVPKTISLLSFVPEINSLIITFNKSFCCLFSILPNFLLKLSIGWYL